jgi:hypothetical protein
MRGCKIGEAMIFYLFFLSPHNIDPPHRPIRLIPSHVCPKAHDACVAGAGFT